MFRHGEEYATFEFPRDPCPEPGPLPFFLLPRDMHFTPLRVAGLLRVLLLLNSQDTSCRRQKRLELDNKPWRVSNLCVAEPSLHLALTISVL